MLSVDANFASSLSARATILLAIAHSKTPLQCVPGTSRVSPTPRGEFCLYLGNCHSRQIGDREFFRARIGYNSGMSSNTGSEGEAHGNIDDSATIDRLRTGGQEALAQLYQEHRGRLRRMVDLRMDGRLTKRIDASDVLQDGFVEISKRLDQYLEDPPMPVFVWMRFLVAQQLAAVQRWHFQRQKRDPRREEPVEPPRPTMDSGQMAREFSASLTSPSQAAVRR